MFTVYGDLQVNLCIKLHIKTAVGRKQILNYVCLNYRRVLGDFYCCPFEWLWQHPLLAFWPKWLFLWNWVIELKGEGSAQGHRLSWRGVLARMACRGFPWVVHMFYPFLVPSTFSSPKSVHFLRKLQGSKFYFR